MPPRFFLPPEQCGGPSLVLRGSEAHHGLHVLRLRQGDTAKVMDGAGTEYDCEVRQTTRAEVHLGVVGKRIHEPPPCRITLLQAIPRAKLLESIIQKATELGAYRIVPLLAERVVSHLNPDEAARKGARWQEVAVEAVKQCGAAWLPRVEAPLTPEGFLARKESFDLALIGSLRPDAQHPREYLQREHGGVPKTVALWIGPEGDFTPAELHAAQMAGAKPITLGRLILRVETAAIYSLSVLNYELSWMRR